MLKIPIMAIRVQLSMHLSSKDIVFPDSQSSGQNKFCINNKFEKKNHTSYIEKIS